ncbi:MFS transporter [Pedobacter caeni]|uniref:Predicted arabinose efflux permease, MFS family n=1 Tax=Pedobacter caeni TaxID=288992 RepID=A0A1M4VAY0_9SPHI|nr:Predicted arabinose efflux permease, MFS family [Pedobacter caeni]
MNNKTIKTKTGMPLALWALTISAFAIGTTEFVIVGLLPTVAKDLAISIPSAGLLVSFYAIGVAIGAPVLTALTNKFPRKPLLIYLMVLFVAGNLLAGISPGFMPLVMARIITGFAHGVFFAVGATIAAALVPADKRASAIAIMFAGLTVAMATGVPLGTLIGQHFGWRATFLGVAGLGLIGLLANLFLLPGNIKNEAAAPIKEQFGILGNKKLLLAFLTTIFNYAGVFLVFTYLSPLLMELTGMSQNMVSLMLLVYGIAIAVGNIIGGKLANKVPLKALLWMLVIQAVVLLIFSFTVHHTIPAIITLFVVGALSFGTVPASQLFVVQTAERFNPAMANVASAFNIASFNAGAALGAYAGGWVVSSTLGLGAAPWVGAIFVLVSIVLALLSAREEKLSEQNFNKVEALASTCN